MSVMNRIPDNINLPMNIYVVQDDTSQESSKTTKYRIEKYDQDIPPKDGGDAYFGIYRLVRIEKASLRVQREVIATVPE